MTEPKKFKKGKHSYVRYGPNFKEVRVEKENKTTSPPAPSPVSVSVDFDAQTAMGVYANMTMIHQSDSEVILDFVFIPPGQSRGRTRARVILPPKQAKKLASILTTPKS
ncbi:hypothetical protein BVX98_07905 [bacterium F11]|nr:hypothetical protein BVX98_07905 [bacterium F11]